MRRHHTNGEPAAHPRDAIKGFFTLEFSDRPGLRKEDFLSDLTFEKINEAKTSLDHVYNRPDPRAYFRELHSLGYDIPGAAKPIFQKVISQLEQQKKDTVQILDIGCSYGINAALLKHDLSMTELYDHWEHAPRVTPGELVTYDREFLDRLDRAANIEVIGLDPAENAILFAEQTGVLDKGLIADLETQPLPPDAVPDLAPIDLVMSTGAVGYVTEKSFDKLLPAVVAESHPWFANFVLRMFPFDPIEQKLSEWGFVTEKLEGQTFIQRQFANEQEQEQVMRQLAERGIDPSGKEADGSLHAEFFLSRPADEAAAMTLSDILKN